MIIIGTKITRSSRAIGQPAVNTLLRREGVEREVLHSEARTLRGDAPYGVHSGLMAVASVLSSLGSPSPVTIHDDGDVLWYPCHVHIRCFILYE